MSRSVHLGGEDGEADEPDLVTDRADHGVLAVLQDVNPRGGPGLTGKPDNLDWFGQPRVPDHQVRPVGRHYQVLGEHHQLGQTVPLAVSALQTKHQ